MRRAEVEAWGDFDTGVIAELPEEFESTLEPRTNALQAGGESCRHSGLPLARLENPDPSVDSGLLPQREPLLETNLRIPPPQIARPSQRRDSHLRQRIRIA